MSSSKLSGPKQITAEGPAVALCVCVRMYERGRGEERTRERKPYAGRNFNKGRESSKRKTLEI